MTPIFFNSSTRYYSPCPNDIHHENHLSNHQLLSPNSQASSSTNSLQTHMFSNSEVHDENWIFDRELHVPRPQHEGDNFGSQTYNDHRSGNNNDQKSIEFSTWNKSGVNNMNDQNQIKWMSSKMRVMLKMKKSDPVNINIYSSNTREVTKLENRKSPASPMEETDNSSNSTSNTNMPIRVCSNCNTIKTPLWRSGPSGPKSLCNACGIRQRKARRALAATLAENGNNNNVSINKPIIAQLKVTKTQNKDQKKPNNGHVTKYKKRQYTKHITITTPSTSPSPSPTPSPSSSSSPSPTSSSPVRKNCVEEFLVSLSKNLTCNRVFPKDDKEAAILLMALSCGYAHET